MKIDFFDDDRIWGTKFSIIIIVPIATIGTTNPNEIIINQPYALVELYN